MPNNSIALKKRIKIFQMALNDEFVNNISKKAKVSWQTARKYSVVMNEIMEDLHSKGMDKENSKIAWPGQDDLLAFMSTTRSVDILSHYSVSLLVIDWAASMAALDGFTPSRMTSVIA